MFNFDKKIHQLFRYMPAKGCVIDFLLCCVYRYGRMNVLRWLMYESESSFGTFSLPLVYFLFTFLFTFCLIFLIFCLLFVYRYGRMNVLRWLMYESESSGATKQNPSRCEIIAFFLLSFPQNKRKIY